MNCEMSEEFKDSGSFRILPDEVMLKIFQHLQEAERKEFHRKNYRVGGKECGHHQNYRVGGKILDIRLVCKRFHAIAWDVSLLTDMDVRNDMDKEQVFRAIDLRPRLSQLNLLTASPDFLIILKHALLIAKDLKRVSIHGQANFIPELRETLDLYGASLEDLGLYKVHLYDVEMTCFSNLSRLSLEDVSNGPNFYLNFKNLLLHCANLKALKIKYVKIRSEGNLGAISNCIHLEELHLECVISSDLSSFNKLRKLKKLKKLVWFEIKDPQDNSLEVGCIEELGLGTITFPGLTALALDNFRRLSDETLEFILKNCPALKVLYVGCFGSKEENHKQIGTWNNIRLVTTSRGLYDLQMNKTFLTMM